LRSNTRFNRNIRHARHYTIDTSHRIENLCLLMHLDAVRRQIWSHCDCRIRKRPISCAMIRDRHHRSVNDHPAKYLSI
jgi:hypothetical protein